MGRTSSEGGDFSCDPSAEGSPEIHRLISSLSSTLDSQRRAAMDLRLLTKHKPSHRLTIACAGAIPLLVSLASHPDPLLQEHSITALLNLSLSDSVKPLLISAGAVRPLVQSLKSGSPAARENGACALFRLSDHKIEIGRSGAIPLLVNLLESGRPRGKKDAATAIYALCDKCRENTIWAVEAGVVAVLLDLMLNLDSGLVEKAGFVIWTVAVEEEGRKAAAEEGGIEILVEVMEMGRRREKAIAAAALLQICEESAEYRTIAVREGAIPPLVALSQSCAAVAKQKAEQLLELLRRQARSGGGLEPSM